MNKIELEKRLINFSVLILEITDEIPNNRKGNHLSWQLIRSGTSASLNYGEAQSGARLRRIIHKIKIVLKELRETYICLKIIRQAKLCKVIKKIEKALNENNELISIFVKSVETAQKNIN